MQNLPGVEGEHASTEAYHEWIEQQLRKSYSELVATNLDSKRLPKGLISNYIIKRYLRNEYLELPTYQFKHTFLRLPNYQDLEQIRQVFKPLRQVNSPNLTAKYFTNSVVAFLRAQSFDDIHKAMKYGLWGPDDHEMPIFKDLLLKGSKESKKVIIIVGTYFDNYIHGIAELRSHSNRDPFPLWYHKGNWTNNFGFRFITVRSCNLETQRFVNKYVLTHQGSNWKITKQSTAVE